MPYVDWIMDFVTKHRSEILALAGDDASPKILLETTKQIIADQGSIHLPAELKDQLTEIQNALWYAGEKGDHDRAQIAQDWTILHAAAWRRWRICEYHFVANRIADRIVDRLMTVDQQPRSVRERPLRAAMGRAIRA